ncbi:hypothetical protein [Fodinicurvata sediminis]|uniref:hypothetical protein n=1 Tax=Fodinicurvata sediminis TaxID=1121832 RepID=UPI0003B2F272|nr:hypothetical protein [Fodinicurvata sediminis]
MATPLTREAVNRVLGPVGNTLSAELVATGASAEELQEAHAWLHSDEALINEGRPLPTGRVAELLDILKGYEESEEMEP